MAMAASYQRGKEPGNSKSMWLEASADTISHQRPEGFWRVACSSVEAEEVDSNISSGRYYTREQSFPSSLILATVKRPVILIISHK